MKPTASGFCAILSAIFMVGTLTVHAQTQQPAQAPAPEQVPAETPTPKPAPPASRPEWKEGHNCVRNTTNDINVELKSGRWPAGPELLNTTYFLPAGGTADVVLAEPFKEGTRYFGYLEQLRNEKNRNFLRSGMITASAIPDNHALVTKGLAEKGHTLLTLRIPDSIGGAWKKAALYVYTCVSPGSPKSVSLMFTRISSPFYSSAVVWLAIVVLYVLAALAFKATDPKRARWYRYLDPVYITAGIDGKGSLSKLQILFFSMIVFGLLTYIVARTGVLSDLSGSVLLLLGIAGVGSMAAKGTDAHKNQLSSDNRAWLIRKGWLSAGGLAAENKASWRDIITSDGEFDVYRYQTVIFSLTVGVALIAAGITELASFTIPETLLGILGLSQVVYIGGKLVAPTSVGELNTAVTELRTLEKTFVDGALEKSDPNPGAGGDALAVARRRAGDVAYNTYLDKAKNARILFETVTGRTVNPKDIEPTLA